MRGMKTIRGGKGLGDSLYVLGVARHLVESGEKNLVVYSDHSDLYADLNVAVKPFARNSAGIIAHYIDGKRNTKTTMWQDVCKSAKVDADFKASWRVKNQGLVDDLRTQAMGRPIVIVVGGRLPMDRKDGFGNELLPMKKSFDAALDLLRDCFLVQVGKADQVYELRCDLNLNGQTAISDLMDIASTCDGVVGQCSFAVPLAEIFDKPFLLMWSAKVRLASHWFIKVMTPEKVMSGKNDRVIVDDWSAEKMHEAVAEFKSLMRIK